MNWYRQIKLSQYGVVGSYGFWIDPEGKILDVDAGQMHKGVLSRSGWLDPNWREKFKENPYAAAGDKDLIRVAVEMGSMDGILSRPAIQFDGCGRNRPLTPQQKKIIFNMALEFKRDTKGKGLIFLDSIGDIGYMQVDTVEDVNKLLSTMASSNPNIKTAKRETITFNRYGRLEQLDYLVNPTKQEILGFIKKIAFDNQFDKYRSKSKFPPSLRGLFVDGNLYVWDSWGPNHCTICKLLGGGCEHLECYSDDDNPEPGKFPGDALTFMPSVQGELITNLPKGHSMMQYFGDQLVPHNNPTEWGEDVPFWTYKWE